MISLNLVYTQVIMPDTEKTTTWRQKKYVVIAISVVVVAAIVVGGFIGGMYLMHKSSGVMVEVKLASKKNASLIKLPPCEASFTHHVMRASWQTKIWMTSHIAMQDTGSP